MTAAATLQDAVRARDAAAARDLLDRNPALLDAPDATGLPPIMLAVYYSATDIVDELISRGAAVDVFAAAALGQTDRLTELLDAEPGLIHAYSVDGWTPLHLAGFFGHPDAVNLLADRGANLAAVSRNAQENMPLHAATANGKRAAVEALLGCGADVNTWGHGWTALHLAAGGGNLELAEVLLAAGANLNARSDDGHTPLSRAAEGGHPSMIELLRGRGAAG